MSQPGSSDASSDQIEALKEKIEYMKDDLKKIAIACLSVHLILTEEEAIQQIVPIAMNYLELPSPRSNDVTN